MLDKLELYSIHFQLFLDDSKRVAILPQLFSCFAVKPHKCFVEHEHQHGGEQVLTEFSLRGELFL